MPKDNFAPSPSLDKLSPAKDLSFSISAPGKVILHGEHSVVYNKLAIAASLGLRTRLKFMELDCSPGNSVTIELPSLNLVQHYDLNILQKCLLDEPLPLTIPMSEYNWEKPESIDHSKVLSSVQNFIRKNTGSSNLNVQQNLSLCSILYLFTAIMHSINIPIKLFVLKIDTDLTVSAGTGSSASFAVTLAAAFIHYIRLKISQASIKNVSKNGYKCVEPLFTNLIGFNEKELELISKWAYMAEKIIHGSPSGIDNTVCTYGSIVEFRKSGGLRLIPKCEFKLILINTQIQRNTKRLVEHVASLKEHHPKIVELILNAMDETSHTAVTCLMELLKQTEQSDVTQEVKKLYDTLGELIDINQHLLQALGVSHPTLDKICAISKDAGLHGKLTGAGGGGYAIVLVPPYVSQDTVEHLINQLNSEGFHAILTKLGGSGVTINQDN